MRFSAGCSSFLYLCVIFVYLLIPMFPLAAEEAPRADKTEADDIVLYRNEALGFQISLPDSLREAEGDQNSVTFESEDNSTHLSIALNDDLSLNESEDAEKDLEIIGRTMLASAMRTHKDPEVMSSGVCFSGGRKAYKNICLFTVKGKKDTTIPIYLMQLVTVHHGRLLLVQSIIIRGDGETSLKRMEKALETLTFYKKLAF